MIVAHCLDFNKAQHPTVCWRITGSTYFTRKQQSMPAAEEMQGRLTTRNRISRKSRAVSETLSKWENGSVTFYLMKTYENIKVFVISEASFIHVGPRTHAGIWYLPFCSEHSLAATEPTKTLFLFKEHFQHLHHFKNAQSVGSRAPQGFSVGKEVAVEGKARNSDVVITCLLITRALMAPLESLRSEWEQRRRLNSSQTSSSVC